MDCRELLAEALAEVRLLSEYARSLEDWGGVVRSDAMSDCGPPISRWEVFDHVPEDLPALRKSLEDLELAQRELHKAATLVRWRIQDEELRLHWAEVDRKHGYGRAWTPPALVGVEGEKQDEPSPGAAETAPSVPTIEQLPVESIAELAGKPRRRRAR